MAVTGMMTGAPALAFLGGFAGGDTAAVVLVAVSATPTMPYPIHATRTIPLRI